LSHGRTGDIVWSRSFPLSALDDATGQKHIANTVIASVGDVYGVISSDAFHRLSQIKDAPAGYLCILMSFDYLKSRNADQQPAVGQCLDGLISENPDDARLSSLKAIVLVRDYLDATSNGQGAAELQRALTLARRAYELEPSSARAQFGIFLTQFYEERFEEAFDAARKTMETNPHSSIMAASIGAAHISRGDFAEGDALLAPLMKMESNAPRAFLAFAALSAYMRGDVETAWGIATGGGQDHNSIGLLMRILVCQQRRDRNCVKSSAQQLKFEFPGFASNLPASLDRYAFSGPIKTRIINDLTAGGLLTNGAI
jgi:adenylate cyclase